MSDELKAFRASRLKAIYARYAKDYRLGSLRAHGGPKRLCPGRGSMTPRAILVGEAPGSHDSHERKPFVGPAGKILNGVLASIGLTRSDVFVTNVVKYRPTQGTISIRNRTPNLAEQIASWPYLFEEVDVFPVDVPLITLGNIGLHAYHWDPTGRISQWHGQGWMGRNNRPCFAWYHPAVAVYDESEMDVLLDDARSFADMHPYAVLRDTQSR